MAAICIPGDTWLCLMLRSVVGANHTERCAYERASQGQEGRKRGEETLGVTRPNGYTTNFGHDLPPPSANRGGTCGSGPNSYQDIDMSNLHTLPTPVRAAKRPKWPKLPNMPKISLRSSSLLLSPRSRPAPSHPVTSSHPCGATSSAPPFSPNPHHSPVPILLMWDPSIIR